jgi:hypothetical protein
MQTNSSIVYFTSQQSHASHDVGIVFCCSILLGFRGDVLFAYRCSILVINAGILRSLFSYIHGARNDLE